MKIAIYGAGGFAREVAPLTRAAAMSADVVFVSDMPDEIGTDVNGLRVISYQELLHEGADRLVSVAIADGPARRAIVEQCARDGLGFVEVRAATHLRYHDVTVGEGAIICENTVFTSNVRIGRHFHCNIYSYVAHDCVIGDFVTFAPRVNCNGRIIVEDNAYIGTGAILRQGESDKPLFIGHGATVGMGAVVTKDVPPGITVVGNPARELEVSPAIRLQSQVTSSMK